MQFNTHPNIDKAMYTAKRVLGVRDPSKPFPVGVPQGILKWRFQSTDVDMVPITINCWPTPSGSETYINIEYEATTKFDLQNVVITIPGAPLPHLHCAAGRTSAPARMFVSVFYAFPSPCSPTCRACVSVPLLRCAALILHDQQEVRIVLFFY